MIEEKYCISESENTLKEKYEVEFPGIDTPIENLRND